LLGRVARGKRLGQGTGTAAFRRGIIGRRSPGDNWGMGKYLRRVRLEAMSARDEEDGPTRSPGVRSVRAAVVRRRRAGSPGGWPPRVGARYPRTTSVATPEITGACLP